jgi:carbonic anhydrase
VKTLEHLFKENRAWARQIQEQQPGFFRRLAAQQRPEFLWIGCSDSRVPANQIVNLLPGEIFVHRNIANLVQSSDLNCLSVVQYAVEVLNVKHVIVCGHYGCGGVQAAIDDTSRGLIDYWVWPIRTMHKRHRDWLDGVDRSRLGNVLCELNVIEQVFTLSWTRVIRRWWDQGHELDIHGWIYGIEDGLLRDLGMCCTRTDDPDAIYAAAHDRLRQRHAAPEQ